MSQSSFFASTTGAIADLFIPLFTSTFSSDNLQFWIIVPLIVGFLIFIISKFKK